MFLSLLKIAEEDTACNPDDTVCIPKNLDDSDYDFSLTVPYDYNDISKYHEYGKTNFYNSDAWEFLMNHFIISMASDMYWTEHFKISDGTRILREFQSEVV